MDQANDFPTADPPAEPPVPQPALAPPPDDDAASAADGDDLDAALMTSADGAESAPGDVAASVDALPDGVMPTEGAAVDRPAADSSAADAVDAKAPDAPAELDSVPAEPEAPALPDSAMTEMADAAQATEDEAREAVEAAEPVEAMAGPAEPAVEQVVAPKVAPAAEPEMSMMELLMEQGNYFPGQFQRGDAVDGIVVRKDKNQLILDIGAKQEGIVPASDLMRMPEGYIDQVKVGDAIKGIILRPEGEIIVSVHQALTMADWDKAREQMDSGEILELEIVGYNKGGAIVQYGNLQGFVPRSHLAEGAGRAGEEGDAPAPGDGRKIPVKVIEVSRRKRRLIMSERQALREWRSTRKQRLLETLREGDVRRGRVNSVADFGAFVDLGGADGLVHVSEMTHERGKHPRDIVQVGQEVEVQVLSIDREHSRIGLSMKRLQSDPWTRVEQDHYVGELVEATISNLTKFGAFARLDDGLEGLIHISELSDEHVEHPREAAKSGQRVTVEILSIDPRHKRIGLSIRRVPPQLRQWHPEDEAGEIEAPPAEPELEPEPAPVAEAAAARSSEPEPAADEVAEAEEAEEVAEPEALPEPDADAAEAEEPESEAASMAMQDDGGAEDDEIADDGISEVSDDSADTGESADTGDEAAAAADDDVAEAEMDEAGPDEADTDETDTDETPVADDPEASDQD